MDEKVKKEIKDGELIQDISKKLDEEHNRILRNFFIILGFITIVITSFIIVGNLKTHFTYEGVEFDIVDEIAPYRTSLPVTYKDPVTGAAQNIPQYFYMRNSPKDLEGIEFLGELEIKRDFVVNSDEDFTCNGYGVIGVANLANLYNVLGSRVVKDQNATCDEDGRYMFLRLESGEKTVIEKDGPSCYTMKINNCEILPATEKFMLETFIKVNEIVES